MKLICAHCGNYTYFTSDVEGLRAVRSTVEGIVVEDAVFDNNWNWSDSVLRDNLQDVVDWVLKQSDQALSYDTETGRYYNSHISCARCDSKRVCPPYSKWSPPKSLRSLEEELMENRNEFKYLRKERHYANQLPVMWEP